MQRIKRKWKKYYKPIGSLEPVSPSARAILSGADISRWLSRQDRLDEKIVVPFGFEIEQEVPTKTVLQLKTRFYKWHSDYKLSGLQQVQVLIGIEPIALKLNPFHGFDSDATYQDTWYAVYYKSYHVQIVQNRSHPMSGPHVAKLYVEPYPGHYEWIGTTQFMGSFFTEEKMRINLRRAIRLREYWCSESTEDIEIPMVKAEMSIIDDLV